MEHKTLELIATITAIGELEQIRRTVRPDMYKRILTLQTEDGQILFPEIRNASLKILDREGIEVNTKVRVNISFQGSEKSGRKYNNILIHTINRV